MISQTDVVLILILLELLQVKQSKIINHLPNEKAIILNRENNQKLIQDDITQENYIHVFTSLEITLSKKFKKHILDQNKFINRLWLLAIDEIHLVDEWEKQFRPLYTKIQKIQKQMPCHLPLLGVFATLTKKA